VQHAEIFQDGDEGNGPGFDLPRLLRMLRRQFRWIAATTALALIPALILPFALNDHYSATASIEVTSRPQVMEMGSDFMPGDFSRQRDPLAPVMAVTRSDSVLGRVVDELPGGGGDGEASEAGPGERFRRFLGMDASQDATPEQQRKLRIELLRRSIELTSEDSILRITAYGRSPEQVTFLANSIADSVLKHGTDRREEASRRAMSWLNTQIFDLRGKIDRQKEAITDLVARTGIKPEEFAQPNRVSERSELDSELQTSQVQLYAMRQRIAELEPSVALALRGARGSSDTPRLREQYGAAQSQLEAARLTYTATHPEVRRLEDVVANLKKRLGSDLDAPMPASTDEISEYRLAKADEKRLAAQVALLERALTEMTTRDSTNSDAMNEYERRRRELAIDEQTLADLQDRRNKTMLGASSEYENARILDYAIPPSGPSGPNRAKWLVAGLCVALALGAGVGLARDLLDQSTRDPEEAAQLLRAQLLGIVPRIHDGTPPERQSDGPPSSLSAESYRNLRTALLFALGGSKLSSLLITSSTAGEGKSTVSSNLASSFAQAGRRILLVDADLRLPRLHKVFGMTPSPGLAELIRGDVTFEEALRRPADGRFDILTAGKVPPNPSELLASPDFALILARMKASYDLVLIDSPVLLGVSDSYILGAQVDGTLLVHRPGSVPKRALEEIRTHLNRARVNLVGVALNQVERTDRHFYPLYMESPYISKGKAAGKRRPARRRA
jgi:polysaccharide biosynthesis transport protein